ncbi:MAG TPA: protein kinase [Kofleriaceae bacterium]|jgi:serine/threonine-protein kinase
MGASTDRGQVAHAPSADDPTGEHDLHAVDTVLLDTRRAGWDDRPTVDDQTRVDARAYAEASSSREITAESPRAITSLAHPTAAPGSNPEPTVATKLDPGVAHLVPGTLVGEFVIEGLLGSGAMGQVYGAQHERLGKRVAIKVIAPGLCRDHAAIERFEQEAVALARISHPNLVGVLSVGTLPGDSRSFYVMDWLEGETLGQTLERAPLAVEIALDVLDQIARGLEAAHAAGIVHRDLKPDNVFLQRIGAEPRPVVRIVDFGLAKLAQHRRSEETQAGVIFGTPTYLSPEQCQSARDVGPATDVYALGVIAYEVVCHQLPFGYDNMAELVAAHQAEVPPRPRDLSPTLDPRLDELLLAMLAKDPARRPTLATVRSTLAAVRAAPSPASRSHRALLAAIAGVAVVAFLGTLAFVQRTEAAVAPNAAGVDARVLTLAPPPSPDAAIYIDAGVAVAPDAADLATPVIDAARSDAPSRSSTPPPTAATHDADLDRAPPRVRRPTPHPSDPPAAPPRRDLRDQTYNPFHPVQR